MSKSASLLTATMGLQTEPAAVLAAQASPQASVRARAARVLKLLGVEGAGQPASQASAAPPATAAAVGPAPVPDLLGGLEDDPPAPATPEDMLGRCSYASSVWVWEPAVIGWAAGSAALLELGICDKY